MSALVAGELVAIIRLHHHDAVTFRTFAMVDTCCDPTPIDYVIPANDDAAKSIECVLNILCKAIEEGLEEKKLAKDKEEAEEEAETKVTAKKLRARKGAKPVDVEDEAPVEEAPAADAE